MKTAVCTCIKDENDYLKEWIDWNLKAGFDHIYLYEDNGSKSHKSITDLYPKQVTLQSINVVKDEPITIERRQRQTYDYSINTLKDKYDWIAFIDADEFIDFEQGYDLHKLLKEYDSYPAIMLSWMLYNANGRINKPNCGVVEAYPNPTKNILYTSIWFNAMWTIKSIVNTKYNPEFINIHLAKDAVNMKEGTKPKLKIFKKAWLRHYYTKSWEEWVWRIYERGDLCNGNRKIEEFFKANPDLKYKQNELLESVKHLIPRGSCVLDEEKEKLLNVTKL